MGDLNEKTMRLQREFVFYGEEKGEKRLSDRESIWAYTARQSLIIAGVKAKASILEVMMALGITHTVVRYRCSVAASTQQVRWPRAVR